METMNEEVQRQVADELGLYVYMLVDPSSGVPFYVGKGRGTRFASHGWEAMLGPDDTEEAPVGAKIARIREIGKAGLEIVEKDSILSWLYEKDIFIERGRERERKLFC